MRPFWLLLFTGWLIIACSALPPLQPGERSAHDLLSQKCQQLFPEGKWQFVHSIEARPPGGQKNLLIGVTIISSRDKSAHCVLMTIEGLVVFDATYDGKLVIKRALTPFDHGGFAAGLIDDIRLIFFVPEGPRLETGQAQNGASVCRYQNPDGRIIDLVIRGDRSWQIRRYSRQLRLTGTVSAFFSKKSPTEKQSVIPARLELKAHGVAGYNLNMNLVEAVELKP